MSTLPYDALKTRWLDEHRGVLTHIAKSCNYTASFVREVYWGTRRTRAGDVERILAEEGAPGFAVRESAA